MDPGIWTRTVLRLTDDKRLMLISVLTLNRG